MLKVCRERTVLTACESQAAGYQCAGNIWSKMADPSGVGSNLRSEKLHETFLLLENIGVGADKLLTGGKGPGLQALDPSQQPVMKTTGVITLFSRFRLLGPADWLCLLCVNLTTCSRVSEFQTPSGSRVGSRRTKPNQGPNLNLNTF